MLSKRKTRVLNVKAFKLLLATDSTSPFYTLAQDSQVEPPIARTSLLDHSKASWRFGISFQRLPSNNLHHELQIFQCV